MLLRSSILCSTLLSLAIAGMELSNTLGSGMVLQRSPGMAQLFGFALPGATITTQFKRTNYTTAVGADGVWRQALPPQHASFIPATLLFWCSDGSRANLTGVLFGDVHICGGQSESDCALACLLTRWFIHLACR